MPHAKEVKRELPGAGRGDRPRNRPRPPKDDDVIKDDSTVDAEIEKIFASQLDVLKTSNKNDWGRGPLSRPDAQKARLSEAARTTLQTAEQLYGRSRPLMVQACREKWLGLVHEESALNPVEGLTNEDRPSKKNQLDHKAENEGIRAAGKAAAQRALGLEPSAVSHSSADERGRHESPWNKWTKQQWVDWNKQQRQKGYWSGSGDDKDPAKANKWRDHADEAQSSVSKPSQAKPWNVGAPIEEIIRPSPEGSVGSKSGKRKQDAEPSSASSPGPPKKVSTAVQKGRRIC